MSMKILASAIAIALLAAAPAMAQSAVDTITRTVTETAVQAGSQAATDAVNRSVNKAAGVEDADNGGKKDKKAKRDKDGPNLGKSGEHRQDAEHRKSKKK
jgi:hypothetical protein